MRAKISRGRAGLLLIALMGLLTSLLAACGDATSTPASSSGYPSSAAAIGATGAATMVASNSTTENASGGQVASATPQPKAADTERKVIRNATIYIEVNNLEQGLAQLRAVAVDTGGIVFQENSQDRGAVIVLQIPSQAYESAVTRIRQSATKVLRQESAAQDVTEEYVDLRSQIVNLQRTEENLQKLMDKTQNLNEVLTLQKELTNTRGEIEKRQGRLNFLDKRSAYSTITINVTLPVPATDSPNAKSADGLAWQPDKTAGDAWTASLRLLAVIGTAGLSLLVFGWWFLPFVVIGLIWWRRRRRYLASLRAEFAGRKSEPVTVK